MSVKRRPRTTVCRAEKIFKKHIGKFIYETKQGGYITMRSTWEVLYAGWLDSQGYAWDYEPMAFRTSWGFYFPDFWVRDLKEWHEVKGRLKEISKRKMDEFKELYPNEVLKMVDGKELKRLKLLPRKGE